MSMSIYNNSHTISVIRWVWVVVRGWCRPAFNLVPKCRFVK